MNKKSPDNARSRLFLSLTLLLTLPAVVQAQFNYVINNGTITLTGYTGPGGAVTIPSTINGLPVTTIGDRAFSSCSSLASVTLPNSITNIGRSAFDFCVGLTNLTIPNSVTGIGDWAFSSCSSLASVTLPANLTCIGQLVFSWCTSLTRITLPESLTSIGDSAFYSCSSLASVTLPNSITNLGGSAFASCTSLTNVALSTGLATIEVYAFAYCSNLTAITLGTNVTYIDSGAFGQCTGLAGVYFRGNPPGTGWGAFDGANQAIIYYLPGISGWSSTFAGRPARLWQPRVQTGDASFGVRTNQFSFTINWASGMTVVVEACTNLANPTWSPVGTNTLTGGSSYFRDPQRTNYPGRFYRLRWP